jgi:streptomycin 6-kinase
VCGIQSTPLRRGPSFTRVDGESRGSQHPRPWGMVGACRRAFGPSALMPRWSGCWWRNAGLIITDRRPGRGWTKSPNIARSWARRWGPTLGVPLAGGSVSIVLSAQRKQRKHGPAVLKLAAPWSRWSNQEAAALRAWDGHGAIRLLAASDDGHALLLERAWPGTPATGMTATDMATLLGKLSHPAVPPGMSSLADALRLRFDRARENRHRLLSAAQISRARCAAVELAGTLFGSPVICHGDLMSKNILISDDRGLLAIDPNPSVGYLAYDAAQWALTETLIADAPDRATALAAALGIPMEQVVRWVRVLTAVEACLASLPRAKASLELARHIGAEWLSDVQ